jgi:hypothetical protein
MRLPETEILGRALDKYFSGFAATRALVADLVRQRKNAIEVLILLCARIDALASDSAAEGTPTKRAFLRFIAAYGSERKLFDAVSVGDLYYELAYHRWLLPGTIPQPGRLHRFSRVDDSIIQLLEDAGQPLTLVDSDKLLGALMRILRREFRAMPRQPISKPRLSTASRIEKLLVDAVQRSRLKKTVVNLPRALAGLLDSKKVGTILYEKFRSGTIHGATVKIDPNRFFTESGVYWDPLYSEYYGAFELISFSAPFLSSLLDRCITAYRAHLLAKGKIPPDVHFHVFGGDVFSELRFLDEALLPEGGSVRFRIGSR